MLFSALVLLALSHLGTSYVAQPSSEANAKLIERDGIIYHQFEDRSTNSTIEVVKNSGICETTPGVNTYSGYFSVGEGMNMWFWFFEARNNPESAPLATWLNGGPGCSSMIGLFQENGPCQFYNGSLEPDLNPYSWNEYANMLYIDQPVGVGFSYGVDTVVSTDTAAKYVWKLIQAFFNQFPEYKSRDFAIWTESYGGHYGPGFADYVLKQNLAIQQGKEIGEEINLVALGVNNGFTHAADVYKSYIDYALVNPYRPLITPAQAAEYYAEYYATCLPALNECPSPTGGNVACVAASAICYELIEGPIASTGSFDVYDVRALAQDPNPPSTYSKYLLRPDVLKAIGARSVYQECPTTAYALFSATGDGSRSYLQQLSDVVQSGVQTLLWAGDADWICNWLGFKETADKVSFDGHNEFASKKLVDYTVKGEKKGTYKTVNNLSYLRVFEAGHEVPYYQPEISLQAFKQTMQGKPISST
ncbi:Alpha/Beta hydrolase protein [Aspergillus insuetus]